MQNIWRITDIKRARDNNAPPNSLQERLNITLVLLSPYIHKCNGTVLNVVRKELLSWCRWQGLEKPAQLIGQIFYTPEYCSNPADALDFILIQASHHGQYQPPSPEQIFISIAQSVARLEEPDLSGIDRATLRKTFVDLWENWPGLGWIPNYRWTDWLANLIVLFSEGKVKMDTHLKRPKANRGFSARAVEFKIIYAQGQKSLIIQPSPNPVFLL